MWTLYAIHMMWPQLRLRVSLRPERGHDLRNTTTKPTGSDTEWQESGLARRGSRGWGSRHTRKSS